MKLKIGDKVNMWSCMDNGLMGFGVIKSIEGKTATAMITPNTDHPTHLYLMWLNAKFRDAGLPHSNTEMEVADIPLWCLDKRV